MTSTFGVPPKADVPDEMREVSKGGLEVVRKVTQEGLTPNFF